MYFAHLDISSQASYPPTPHVGRTFSAGAFFVAADSGCGSTNWRLVMKNLLFGLVLTLAAVFTVAGTAEAKKHHGSCGSYGSVVCAPACNPCHSYTSCGSCGDTVCHASSGNTACYTSCGQSHCQTACHTSSGSCGDTACYSSCGSHGKKVKKKHHGSYGSYGSCGTHVHHGSCGSAGW